MADHSEHLYRAYHLSSNGSFAQADVIDAENDRAALSQLGALYSPHGIELWDRQRFVGRIPGALDPSQDSALSA